jgi:hypothetical protein
MCPTAVTDAPFNFAVRHLQRVVSLLRQRKPNRMVANLSKHICHTNREPFLWDFSFASVADKLDSFYATLLIGLLLFS